MAGSTWAGSAEPNSSASSAAPTVAGSSTDHGATMAASSPSSPATSAPASQAVDELADVGQRVAALEQPGDQLQAGEVRLGSTDPPARPGGAAA